MQPVRQAESDKSIIFKMPKMIVDRLEVIQIAMGHPDKDDIIAEVESFN